MSIPTLVRHSDLQEALQPLYDLLGIDAMNVYAEPSMTIGQEITFTIPVRYVGGSERAPGVPEGSSEEIPPHPHGLDVEPVLVGAEPYRELGYEVRVAVDFWVGAA